jgi:hypothetical protein
MNAYELLASFNRQACKSGWPKDKIEKVLADARSGDYEHLKEVLLEAFRQMESGARSG